MTRSSRRGARWPDIFILLAAAVLTVAAVRWADREFDRVEPASQAPPRSVPRPDWLWALERPTRRLINDVRCLPAVATLAVAAILAVDARARGRRRRAGPGAVVIFVALAVGGVTAGSQLVLGPAYRSFSTYYDLSNTLALHAPGAVLGAWVALRLGSRRRGRPVDWRERTARLVGWSWLANVALLIAHPLLFG